MGISKLAGYLGVRSVSLPSLPAAIMTVIPSESCSLIAVYIEPGKLVNPPQLIFVATIGTPILFN